jgi:hypothetical protein
MGIIVTRRRGLQHVVWSTVYLGYYEGRAVVVEPSQPACGYHRDWRLRDLYVVYSDFCFVCGKTDRRAHAVVSK